MRCAPAAPRSAAAAAAPAATSFSPSSPPQLQPGRPPLRRLGRCKAPESALLTSPPPPARPNPSPLPPKPQLMDAGFQELVFEDALEMLAALAAAIGAGPPAGPLTHEALTSNLRDDTVSNMIVMLLRMVTSAELQARGARGAPAAPLPLLLSSVLGAQFARRRRSPSALLNRRRRRPPPTPLPGQPTDRSGARSSSRPSSWACTTSPSRRVGAPARARAHAPDSEFHARRSLALARSPLDARPTSSPPLQAALCYL